MDAQGHITGTRLEPDEMRITFLGSVIPPVRRAQEEMSIFVEVGWDKFADGRSGSGFEALLRKRTAASRESTR